MQMIVVERSQGKVYKPISQANVLFVDYSLHSCLDIKKILYTYSSLLNALEQPTRPIKATR